MKISVLIPTHDRSHLLGRAIDSVLGQSLRPSEVLVIDDGSTDETSRLLQEYQRETIIVIRQEHAGVSAARNHGIREAKEEWIALLDSDDWWEPEKLEKQVAFHRKNPDFFMSQTNEVWLRNGVRVNPKKYHQKPNGWVFADCLERCLISPSAAIINRRILDKVGLFDESLPACEDYDLWLRITRLFKVGLVPEKLTIKTGGHPDQLSAKHWGLDRFRVQSLEKILNLPLSEQQRKETLRVLLTKLDILKNGSAKRGDKEQAKAYEQKIGRYQDLRKS